MERFLMHVLIDYPPVEDEVEVIRLVRGEEIAAQRQGGPKERPAAIAQDTIFAARAEIGAVHVAPAMERYMADLVNATRHRDGYGEDLKRWIEIGASPRASLALDRCGRTHAWLRGRDYVDPEDVRAIAADVLRHRLTLTYEAQGEGVSADAVVAELIAQVALP
jgi:MoxR-like ATPase